VARNKKHTVRAYKLNLSVSRIIGAIFVISSHPLIYKWQVRLELLTSEPRSRCATNSATPTHMKSCPSFKILFKQFDEINMSMSTIVLNMKDFIWFAICYPKKLACFRVKLNLLALFQHTTNFWSFLLFNQL
jgi:hypothetical protein